MAKKTSGFTSEELGPQSNTNIWVCAAYLKMITRGPGFSHWKKFSTGPPMSSPPAFDSNRKNNPEESDTCRTWPLPESRSLWVSCPWKPNETTETSETSSHSCMHACIFIAVMFTKTIRTTHEVVAGQNVLIELHNHQNYSSSHCWSKYCEQKREGAIGTTRQAARKAWNSNS